MLLKDPENELSFRGVSKRGWDITWRWLVLDENVRATLLQTTWNASGVIEVVPPLPWNEVTVRRPALFED